MDIDVDELLGWLKGDESGERDLQIIALEQLCMLLLMSDNIDRCFEQCQPRLFLPALCDIFSDPLAPAHVLEVTARALTYFLDVSLDCAKTIISHDTVIRSMCTCLQAVDIEDRTNKDLAEQIIKVFERVCSREASCIYEKDGLRCVLDFIHHSYAHIHRDSLQSALNVVVKLIGKIDPQTFSTLDQTIQSLSNLLLHDNTFVVDNALRCFATLADRFARKSIDTEPLMRYCLKDVLLRSLHHVSKTTDANAAHDGSNLRGVTANLSVVTGLLSTLCRASAKVTNDLLRSDLPDALQSALCSGDERCVLDTMRFVDLLIVLIFEGRQALPRPPPAPRSSTATTNESIEDPSSTGTNHPGGAAPDQSQQHIIEHIRSRDAQAFINYVEENNIDINYTDHVGQTMLNWVSAFGTREMVEYLCRRGADVNRGQRSSSLHYAACFSRASIVRLLLKYGANTELRDEDGRTSLDKARERQDGSNQEILDLLQSAHEWTDTKHSKASSNAASGQSNDDREIQTTYFERLLSIFCQVYQNTMIVTIKRSTLRLISKLFQYATVEQIHQISFLTTVLELLATILDTNEDDDDTSNLVLVIIKSLFEKDRQAFLEQCQYLGLIAKITSLALSHPVADQSNSQTSVKVNILSVDAREIVCHRAYLWNEFNILRTRECLYIWTNRLIIELSIGSNGWFRFFANNSLSTMYSSGSPESNVDTDENRLEFMDKFQRAKQQVFDGVKTERGNDRQRSFVVRTIFTADASRERTMTVGNWIMKCDQLTQLQINNAEGEQVTVLEHGQSGFVFESSRGIHHVHRAEAPLPDDFSIPWSTVEVLQSSNRSASLTMTKNKQDLLKQRTSEIALHIYNEYLKHFSPVHYTRTILTDLRSIVADLNSDFHIQSFERLAKLFEKLKTFLLEHSSLSVYELSSSGLVDALLGIFQDGMSKEQLVERTKLFCSIFLADDQPQAFQVLVRKLIAMLESLEKLPVFLYDSSLNCGLQIFSKRFRFQIQYRNERQLFVDRTGKALNIEPLATVEQLKAFLASMVSKQWYDHQHGQLDFVKQLPSSGRLSFTYASDFDQNGILYWIGTNGKTVSDYTNPNLTGLVSVHCSDSSSSVQKLANVIAHASQTDENEEESEFEYRWIMIDLGLSIIPTHITVRHDATDSTHWSKTMLFQVSKDNFRFTPCESSLLTESHGSTATWTVTDLNASTTGYRYIRIFPRSGRQLVPIAGFEVYGHVLSAVDIRSKPTFNRSRSARDDLRNQSTATRSTPAYHHSHSTTTATARASKLQSLILRRLESIRTANASMDPPAVPPRDTQASQATMDSILFDLSGMPTNLSTALQSDDPDRLRAAIEETLLRLSNDSLASDTNNLRHSLPQRKHISISDMSNPRSLLSSFAEPASNEDTPAEPVRPSDSILPRVRGRMARQYEGLSGHVRNDPAASLRLFTASDYCPLPSSSDESTGDSWVVMEGTGHEAEHVTLEDETKLKSDSDSSSSCSTPCFTATTGSARKSMDSATESEEASSTVAEENNRNNVTTDCPPAWGTASENETNATVPSLFSTMEMSPNFSTPTTIDIADIPIIDDETSPASFDQQVKQQTDESSDDEHLYLKRLQSNQQEIKAPAADDDDEEQEASDNQQENDDEFQEQIHGQQQKITRRNWDDDFVLKRQFSVLLPAFDGRPGRTNINAAQDIAVPSTMSPRDLTSTNRASTADALAAENMTLFIRGPSPAVPGLEDIDIEMDDPDATIFKYVQQLIQPFPSSQRLERIKRIFEPTYTIVYAEKSSEPSKGNKAPSTVFDASLLSNESGDIAKIKTILALLHHLHSLSHSYIQTNSSHDSAFLDAYFHSKKLNNKLLKQTEDSIIIASSSLPSWTPAIIHTYRFFYPIETRQLYFRTTSFGTSRSIVWLQERREELIRAIRQGNSGRLRSSNENSTSVSVHEFRFGRLKIDRATPIDREQILRDARNLFHYHAESKSKLEIQFLNEEGTGDGPTLEFYALVASELQKYPLGLWWNHDDEHEHSVEFVMKSEGLFPAPYPQTHEKLDDICQHFSLMGIYFAKCLLDKYLIDMPLSIPFLKLLCSKSKHEPATNAWYDGILDLHDLTLIEPSRGKFFQQLVQLVERRNQILNDRKLTHAEKAAQCRLLKVASEGHEPVDIEQLCLTFVYSPPSNTYSYQSVELIPNGSNIDVTIDNVDRYTFLSLQFILCEGIRRQMDAFRNGFNRVFSLDHLRCFNSQELKLLLCGNQWPSWTLDDLLTHIEPTHGFARDSPGFNKFLNVMLALDGFERKSVVQFITGCSSLPPGGLANLRPRLSVARKVEADDNSYPSVNTCYHYLKLPDYSNEDILKLRLLTACQERGFYFN